MKYLRSTLKSVFCFYLLSGMPSFAQDTQDTQDTQDMRDAADQTPRYILDTIVVTGNKIETPLRQVSSSIAVITAEDIERNSRYTVADLLRDVGGLSVAQNGGPGRNASVFLRGAESAYTLFLIDGVEVNDPMSPGRSYSPAHMTVDQVERIEVLYGSQSTLYGSDAIAGVVNIITKQGEGPPKIDASIEGGALGTFRSRAGLSGGTTDYRYAMDGSFLNTRGISSNALGNMEEDGYRNTTLGGRFGATPSAGVSVDLNVRYTDGRADIDNGIGPDGDDPNRINTSRQLFCPALRDPRALVAAMEADPGLQPGRPQQRRRQSGGRQPGNGREFHVRRPVAQSGTGSTRCYWPRGTPSCSERKPSRNRENRNPGGRFRASSTGGRRG